MRSVLVSRLEVNGLVRHRLSLIMKSEVHEGPSGLCWPFPRFYGGSSEVAGGPVSLESVMRRYALLACLPLLMVACSEGEDPGGTPDSGGSDSGDVGIDAPGDGGTDSGDGGTDSGPPTFTVKECETLPAITSGVCAVTAGDAGRRIRGNVLTPDVVYHGGEVVLDDAGKILFVGCHADCEADATCKAKAASATTVSCPKGVVSPGLINAHDHITFAQNNPYTDTGERYEHRHDWRKGLNGHTKLSVAGSASNDQVAWGELRFLMGGATSTVGSGGSNGLLRNLDRTTQEGLGQKPADYETFPLDDSDGTQLASGCTYGSAMSTPAAIAADDAFLPHVSEGINAYALNEFVCLGPDSTTNNILVDKSAYIHGVGLRTRDYAAMAKAGTALIWSPRSNITLYGDTAQITIAKRLGVQIALGTDWISTGSMNILREIACAKSFSDTYLNKALSSRDLWMMTTFNAAAVTATDDVIGILAKDKVGDVTVFDGSKNADFDAVVTAEPKDVALVLRAGKVLYGDKDAVTGLAGSAACDTVDVCGVSKNVCLKGEVGKTYTELQTSVGSGNYPAFFCGAPTKEPSCKPVRPKAVTGSTIYTGDVSGTDSDGDGVPDATDNCKLVFNPVRPMDSGKQVDTDGDGLGDACDPCPFDKDTTTCSVYDPTDADGDGVPSTTDNCPGVANKDQKDTDGDGKGDVCDPCPDKANPGAAACPVSIYDIKKGTVPVGSAVALNNALVTAKVTAGFYLQVKETDTGYAGAEFSGVYVYDPANTVKVGDRVNIATTTISLFNGQIQLTKPTTTVATSAAEASPAPTTVTLADVATGGTKASNYESVLVKVENAAVSELNPTPGPGDTAPNNEYVLDSKLRVNDFLYLTSPFPVVGQKFLSVTGVLDFRNGDSKIEPRGASDVVLGAATIASFGPALSYTRVGATSAPTFPTPLEVVLTSAPTTPTTIGITSSDTALTVVGGGVTIASSTTKATVLVNGVSKATAVTLTASLDGVTKDAKVRVLDVAEVPTAVAITPATATGLVGKAIDMNVELDLPAPAGGTTVTLAVAPTTSGTLPVSVTVPEGKLTAAFTYTPSAEGAATITGTMGSATGTATVTGVVSTAGLIINEVDYDQTGTDTAEYVELINAGTSPISLAGYKLVFLNGSTSTAYLTVDLSTAGTINPGQYLVFGAAAVAVPTGVLKINSTLTTDIVQNGAPDGIALINGSTLVDAISYEGEMKTVTIAGITGTVSLVEGTAATAADTGAGAICRMPNGTDTNNASLDWKLCATSTPGAANTL